VVLAAAIAAAVVFLGGSDSAKSQTNAFSDKVATTFAPVDRANRGVSNALTRLRGSRTNSARAAVSRAQRATSSARGALGALTVPDASQQLATQMRQALDREDTYLTAVGTTLARPSSPGVSQLQTLAGNLTSSLEAVGAPISGAAQNVTGADTLGVWAQRARRKRTSQPTGSTTPAPPSPLAGGRDCGGGLHAGPNTTCEFAANVQQAYYEAPGSAATVDVFSPVTGRTYTMDCRPAGSGTTCSGGNGASVSW
jgi:hypothetical protein